MPRPRRFRMVLAEPTVNYFKPARVPLSALKETILTVDEFEAIRLKDLEELDQEPAAKEMHISQPTFNRLLKNARKKIADAIVNGRAIKIEGGKYKMTPGMGRGRGQGMGLGRGQGRRGRMGGFGAGPEGTCVCPNCGYREAKIRGVPCASKKCPKCKIPLARSQ